MKFRGLNCRAGRMVLSLALIGTGVWVLVGCIYIPTFNAVKQGQNHSKQVGDVRSRRPVRIHKATRHDVRRILGPPVAVSKDGRSALYSWRVRHGYLLWPLCGGGQWHESTRSIELRFDDKGVLTDFAVHSRPGGYRYAMPAGRGNEFRWHNADDPWPNTDSTATSGRTTTR